MPDLKSMHTFAELPNDIGISRSRFDLDHGVKFSGNVGDLICYDVQEIYPGDTFQVDTAKVIRFQTMLSPIMDDIYLDIYHFFVPTRLVWDNFQRFMGENIDGPYVPLTEFTIPTLQAPETTGWTKGTTADYMGIPTGVPGIKVNALPFRAYGLIANEYFRDENLMPYINIYTGDADKVGVNSGDQVTDICLGGKPFVAAKLADYFTRCLPFTQKGENVSIPGGTVSLQAPVIGNDIFIPSDAVTGVLDRGITKFYGNGDGVTGVKVMAGQNSGNNAILPADTASRPMSPWNLGIDTTSDTFSGLNQVSLGTINQLRQAFQIQRFFERSARAGTRYIEILNGMFNVQSGDARLQRPEYLGGNRISCNVHQIANTAETDTAKLGNVGAYSVTSDVHSDFTKSFVEHGWCLSLCVARYKHTYAQGLERFWSRKTRFDMMWPTFAHLGEMAVKNSEIYAQAVDTDHPDDASHPNNQVFGYQEQYADLRYRPSRVAGEMRPQYDLTLASWHLADDYSEAPSLSSDWIREDKTNVDRVLAVSSAVSDQFWMDIFVKCKATRPLPLYSVPGLIDHH